MVLSRIRVRLIVAASAIALFALLTVPQYAERGIRVAFADQPAETVRVIVGNAEYHIPAHLQPYFLPKDAIETRSAYPKDSKWLTYYYSQRPDEPATRVEEFGFLINALKQLVERDKAYEGLEYLHYVNIVTPVQGGNSSSDSRDSCQMPRSPWLPSDRHGEISEADGFRIETIDNLVRLVSTGAPPFLSPITATCVKWRSDGFLVCKARARLFSDTCVEVSLSSRSTPAATWKSIFGKIRDLVHPLIYGRL